ncbi:MULTISPECIES: heavy metal translocating P-type ATPase [unclassified Corynebacterium]|uniref:heavy metal translocating P-type ATPase n=1 Tax=unclassified Corynebacterium TaxID=2624378 RepID=UPI0030B79E9E
MTDQPDEPRVPNEAADIAPTVINRGKPRRQNVKAHNCIAAPCEPTPEEVAELHSEELLEIDNRVTEAIGEAKLAASRVGLMRSSTRDEESMHQRLARRTGAGLTSFGLVMEDLNTAMDAAKAEKILNEFPGVHATVVLDPGRAWITGPDDMVPEELLDALEEHGIEAYLTRSSLRRRATRLDVAPRRRPAVPAAAQQADEDRVRRREAAIRQTGNTEVLFTAKALVTKLRFFISLLLTIPVLAMSLNVDWQFDGWQWVVAGLSTIVAMWGGWPFHRAMVASLRRQMSALDGASSIAILLAWTWSMGELAIGGAGELGFTTAPTWFAFNYDRTSTSELFFDVACGLTVLLLAGRLMTRYNRIRSGSLLRDLKISPDRYVTVVRRKAKAAKPEKQRVPIAELNISDDIVVPAGVSIPVDGMVIGGASRVDERLLGDVQESRAVKVNSKVWAGSINLENSLKIRVLQTGSKTRAAAITRWIQQAIRDEDVAYQTAVRSASVLVPWAIGLAIVSFGIWWLISGAAGGALAVALATLAGVAPVALAMSTSTAQRIGILTGAHRGILIRGAESFRVLGQADVVVFNRVGTLTEGEMHVLTVQAAEGENSELVLRVAGALVMESDHPVSTAIVRACRVSRDAGSGGDDIPHWVETNHLEITDDGSFIGQVKIPVETKHGTTEQRFVEAHLWRPRDMSVLDEQMAVAALAGGAPLIVSWRGKVRGVITVGEDIKPDAVEAIDQIEEMDIDTMMISRDPYPVARRFADRLGISRVSAGIIGPRKPAAVRNVRGGGETVVMVGDDEILPCLRAADVGVLMDPKGSTDNIDLEESGVVTLRGRVTAVPEAIRLARAVSRTMDTNIAIAWTYNIAVLVLSVAGILHPLVATTLMIVSSLFIEWRSRRLMRLNDRMPWKELFGN